jgi:hypothetical protein
MGLLNKIASKKLVGSVVKDGKTVVVSAATKTSTWTRTDAMAQKVGETLMENLKNFEGPLPKDTEEVCSR